jgi:hypothetical protein
MSFETNNDGSYVAVRRSDEVTGYIHPSGQIFIVQSNQTGEDPDVVALWPSDIPRFVKMLRLLAKEATGGQ